MGGGGLLADDASEKSRFAARVVRLYRQTQGLRGVNSPDNYKKKHTKPKVLLV